MRRRAFLLLDDLVTAERVQASPLEGDLGESAKGASQLDTLAEVS